MIMTAEQGADYFKGSRRRRRRVGVQFGSILSVSVRFYPFFGTILSVRLRFYSILARFYRVRYDSIGFGSILSVFVRILALSTQSTSIRLWTLILLAMTVPIDSVGARESLVAKSPNVSAQDDSFDSSDLDDESANEFVEVLESNTNDAIDNCNARVFDASVHADDEFTEEKTVESNTNDDVDDNNDGVADSSFHVKDECTEKNPVESNTIDAIDNINDGVFNVSVHADTDNDRVFGASFHVDDECTEEKPVESNTNDAVDSNNDRVFGASVHADDECTGEKAFHVDDECTEEKPVESNTNDAIDNSTNRSGHGPSISTNPRRTIDLPIPIDSYLRAIITEHETQTNRLGQLRALVKVYCRRFPWDKYNCKTQVDSSIANHKYNTEMFKELLEIVECHQQDNKVEMAKIIRVGFLKNLRLHEECHSIFLKGLVHAMEYHRDKTNRKRLPAQVLRQFMEFRKERELITNLLYSKLEEVEVWHHRARKPIVVGKEPNEFYVIASYLIVSVLALIYDYLQTTAQLV
jgi:hypothetical protein